jgi:hypothetical protein
MFVLAMTSVDRVLTHSPKYCCWTSKSSSKPRPLNNDFTTLNTNRSEGRNGNEQKKYEDFDNERGQHNSCLSCLGEEGEKLF